MEESKVNWFGVSRIPSAIYDNDDDKSDSSRDRENIYKKSNIESPSREREREYEKKTNEQRATQKCNNEAFRLHQSSKQQQQRDITEYIFNDW